MARNRNLEWALAYAERCGVPVFPVRGTRGNACDCGDVQCASPGKHPLTKNGLKDATMDEKQIREWWTKWPNANIGMPTGTASMLWVADLDLPDGERSFAKLIEEYGALPETAIQKTGSGGRQYFFAWTDGIRNSAKRLGPDIDVRGEGGYVVLPPSRHVTGRNYEWIKDHDLGALGFTDAPEWLTALVLDISKTAPATNGTHPEAHIPSGQRNDTLYRLARSLRTKRLKQEAVLAALLSENRLVCSPPLTDSEVENIVANAFKQPNRADFESIAKDEEKEILSADDPLVIARTWAKKYIDRPDGRILHRWDQRFWQWNGAHYDALLDEDVAAPLWAYLHDEAIVLGPKAQQVQPHNRLVADVFAALKAEANLPLSRLKPPSWIGRPPVGMPDADFLPVQNGLLHLGTMQLFDSSPRFFALSSIQTSYEATADIKHWRTFVDSIFPDDKEQVQTLQEVMGYLITSEMEQQKIFMIIGPPRSGKGTIGNVLQFLLGDAGVARLTSGSFAQNFGLAGLIGRPLAILSDTRITDGSNELVERLLTISGQDSIDVSRKFREDWQGKLNTRFLFLTNELPRFWDASGALSSRFLVLETRVSFLGREDYTLLAKLRAELPGILNWAIVGWHRLKERGRFIQPASVDMTLEQFANLSSPIREFVSTHYKAEEGSELLLEEMYKNYKNWSRNQGQIRSLPESLFARDLRACMPTVEIKRQTIDGAKKRVVVGLTVEYWEPDPNSGENQRWGFSN